MSIAWMAPSPFEAPGPLWHETINVENRSQAPPPMYRTMNPAFLSGVNFHYRPATQEKVLCFFVYRPV
jgi:hypothetical protein